jgi:hypothetical protein
VIRIPTFVVIGGGIDGTASVQRLLRASAAGRLAPTSVVVVDRDPRCRASELLRSPAVRRRLAAAGRAVEVRLDVADWSGWLHANLDRLDPAAHLVPYHWAPHLLLHWLEAQVASSGARVVRGPALPARGLPFEATTRGGDRALSYASWPCPPACIEPGLCPHTRGPRDWSLAADLEGPRAGDAFDERIVFRCLHLVWGVGTIPVRDVLAARDRLVRAGGRRPIRALVATSSHCHALASAVGVAPR